MGKKKYPDSHKKKYYYIPTWIFIPIGAFIMITAGWAIYNDLTAPPEIPPGVTIEYKVIDPDEAVNLISFGAKIIDASSEEWYDTKHIPGAINLPLNTTDTCMSCWWGKLMNRVDVNDSCIIYDLSGVRSEPGWLYCKQKKEPYRVYLLRGGFARWETEGYPVETT